MKRKIPRLLKFSNFLLIMLLLFKFSNLAAQEVKEIKGTITDNTTNEPLESVSVQVKGKSASTSSNAAGQYTIEASSTDVLVFSYVGYKNQELPANNAIVNVAMEGDLAQLDEVVVIGYGTQKKSDLTGSVARISMEDKATLANVNLFQALVGASAGVNLEGRGGRQASQHFR